MGARGGLADFGLGHDDLGVTGLVSNFNHEGGGVLPANETGHHADAAACFDVHIGNVRRAHQLVVDEHPGALGALGLLNDFVLRHRDHRMARGVCNFNFKLQFG